MNNGIIAVGPTLAVVLVLLTTTAAMIVWLGRLTAWRPILTAAVRATVQLAAVSLLIVAVLRSGWLTAAFVLMMFAVASLTCGRRIGTWRDGMWTAIALAAGVAPVLGLLTASGLIPLSPIAMVPVAGILIGGAMTATSLAGRRALDELRTRHGEYEAALALGFLPRDAALLISRPTAGQALVPALDQTRTVGLVTLPGAFVGVLLGGATPIQAGATQLVVLIALLAVESAAVLLTVELIAAGKLGSANWPDPGR
ncbi:putative ABC transport system permease protein [Kibdelosporangium banguiense]|uniref:ABC transport system permease protein n=1 Tax=Kibdelosporangium banguiense TaxID=1365924 RepID=A0ABS4TTN8_9PSEU|nr:ABC transporter permease [Kibdelosporangium banguiense]MBP2327768.1 putative ABC transport system permease protein [Kibdelosporangium banguiense]